MYRQKKSESPEQIVHTQADPGSLVFLGIFSPDWEDLFATTYLSLK